MPARTEYLDITKGLLITLVVFGHAWRAIYNNNILHDADLYHMVDSWIYAFHMPAFFFLAGLFALQSAKRTPRQFIERKIQTIAYPYLVWSVLQSSLQLAMAGKTTSTISAMDILKIPITPVMQYWFLYALFFIFLFFILLKQLTCSRTIFLGTGIILFITFMLGYSPGISAYMHIARNFIYFSLGIFCADFFLQDMAEKPPEGFRLFCIISLLFLASLAMPLISTVSSPQIQKWIKPLIALPGLLFVLFSAVGLLTVSKFFSFIFLFLGSRSLEIFVAHTIFSAGFRIAAIRIADIHDITIHLLGATLIGLCGPLLLVFLVNRLGFKYMFTWPTKT